MDHYTITEAAEHLKVSDSTIYGLIRKGKLQASRVGKKYLVSRDQINQFLAKEETIMSGNGERAMVMSAPQIPMVSDIESMMKLAEVYAGSNLVPKEFQGNTGNVFIALEFAYRVGMNVFSVMQSLYIVHGRPSWSGQMAIALVNSSGLFDKPLQFVFDGAGDEYGCTAVTTKNGIAVEGPKVTMKMVTGEKWNKPQVYNKGTNKEFSVPSKWTTLESLMFRYRAGTYFARTICPQVLLGLQTVEEVEDMDHLGGEVYGKAPELPPMIERDGTQPPPPPAEATADWDQLTQGLELVNEFVTYAADSLQTTPEHVRAQALKGWDSFLASYGKWLEKEKAPENPTSPEAREATIVDQPGQSPTEQGDRQAVAGENNGGQPTKGATKAQITIIKKTAGDAGLTEAMVCKEKGAAKYEELTEEQAAEILVWLKSLK